LTVECVSESGTLADADPWDTTTTSDPIESDTPRRDKRLASIALALDRRLDTVPTGHPSWFATSL
jgi:hypothetical protein